MRPQVLAQVGLASLLVGIIDTLGKAYGPAFQGSGAGNVVAALAAMSVYLLMVALLLWRPTGLFGQRV